MVQVIRRIGPKPKIEIETEEYVVKPLKNKLATWDTETDPFMPARVVKPFTCGFYVPDDDFYIDFWGDDCVNQFFDWLDKATAKGGIYEENTFTILCHNFGNFDAYFMVDHFDKGHSPFIINGRLVRIIAHGHEFRDSYAMIPVALGSYDKMSIDYRCMEKGFREIFKDKILEYQKRDCTSLAELVTNWIAMFGNNLTMAGVALRTLNSYHGFETISEQTDLELRPYYFGGRNQCFETGVLQGNFDVYDINSSYPDVMRRYQHPISAIPKYEKTITKRTCFAWIRAKSDGALPIRNDDGSLSFPTGVRDFYACIHEIRAGLETGTLKIIKVYHSIYFDQTSDFSDFIDTFYKLRMDAKADKNDILVLFYKLVMNSSYGKFAQDPRKYENWLFDPDEIPTPLYCSNCNSAINNGDTDIICNKCETKETSPYGWYLHTMRDNYAIYASPQKVTPNSFFNVATAASITSAARASLLYGLQCAVRPVYCDTDSIICEGFEQRADWNVVIDDKMLGAWKSEANGDTVCIAGKKLYAVFNKGDCIKKASKGVKLSASEIQRVCEGEVIEYANPVPKFSLRGNPGFITRRIRKTG